MLTCIFISSKYEEIYPPLLDDYLNIFHSFNKNDILKLENGILAKLNFQLHICSPYLFLTKFYSNMEQSETLLIIHCAQFILDLCFISIEFCTLKPSLQAVICLYIAKKFYAYNKIYKNKLWSDENEFITGYSEEQIKKNIKIPLKIMKEFFSGNIIKEYNKIALFKKYYELKFSNYANYLKDLCLINKLN